MAACSGCAPDRSWALRGQACCPASVCAHGHDCAPHTQCSRQTESASGLGGAEVGFVGAGRARRLPDGLGPHCCVEAMPPNCCQLRFVALSLALLK